MPIRIPLEVHVITVIVSESQIVEKRIRVGPGMEPRRERVTTQREVPPRQDRPSFEQALLYSNNVLRQADIQFNVQSFDTATEEIPGGRDRVDSNGFIYLIGRYPAQSGLSVLLVGTSNGATSAARPSRQNPHASSARSEIPGPARPSPTSWRTCWVSSTSHGTPRARPGT